MCEVACSDCLDTQQIESGPGRFGQTGAGVRLGVLGCWIDFDQQWWLLCCCLRLFWPFFVVFGKGKGKVLGCVASLVRD